MQSTRRLLRTAGLMGMLGALVPPLPGSYGSGKHKRAGSGMKGTSKTRRKLAKQGRKNARKK